MHPAIRFLGLAVVASATLAAAQTRFDHNAPGYVVPEKRVQLAANVTDPKGVKLARVYFKTPAQADYVFVPMTAAGGNRYVATLPAMNASAPTLQYVLLAVNNTGDVSKTQEYAVTARKSSETPAWQSASNQGQMKVYTEAATAPQTVAGFSDSISMDVAESTARFGAAAGLLAGGGGGAGAGATASTSSSTAATTSATAATTGGLSTIAIVGGVAVAGLAAAAASGGGGGGGGGGGSQGPALAGTSWTGTLGAAYTTSCGVPGITTCTFSWPFSGTINSSNVFNGTLGNGTVNCSDPSLASLSQIFPNNSPITLTLSGNSAPLPGSSGTNFSCNASSVNFSLSPKSMSGSQTCTFGSPPCGFTITYSGS